MNLNNSDIYILHNIVNAALGGFGSSVIDNEKIKYLDILLYKIKKLNHNSVLLLTPDELYIIKECVKATLKYLDEDEFHTWLGAEPEEVYRVRDKVMSLEIIS